MTERHTFAHSITGLEHAAHLTVSLRRAGFKTRLETVPIKLGGGFTTVMHNVIATSPVRPNRAERGCGIGIIPRRKP